MKYIYKTTLITLLFSTSLYADIIMGIVPQQSPHKLLKVWKPISEYLSKTTGENIIFKTEKSIGHFEKILYNGGYDFAYMNPYHYIIAHNRQSYIAKIRATKNIQGILVAKKGIKKDYKNQNTKFIFPSPNAFAATLLTKDALMTNFGVTKEQLNKSIYVNSHDSVYKAISRGVGDVGGGIIRTLKNIDDKKSKANIHIVYKTPIYPSHPFAFKSSMDKDKVAKITKAILSMPDDMLKSLNIESFIKIDNNEYDTIRRLAVRLNLEIK